MANANIQTPKGAIDGYGATRIRNAMSAAVKAGAYSHGAEYLRILRQHERKPMSREGITETLWSVALSKPFGWAL